MTTKRRPLKRSLKRRITPAAIAIFKRMRSLEDQCTCLPSVEDVMPEIAPVDVVVRQQCKACQERLELEWQLHKELRLMPWQGGPVVAAPDETCVYPVGTAGHEWFPVARELYDALDEAVKATGA